MKKKTNKEKIVKEKEESMRKSLLIYIVFVVILTATIIIIFRIANKINQENIRILNNQIRIYQLENERLRRIIEDIKAKANSAVLVEPAVK